MFEQIKILLGKIAFHQTQHKLTIFNKQKNLKNTHLHNLGLGKLIEELKRFHYFNQHNQNLGSQYLIQTVKYLEPHLLRKDSVLINSNRNEKIKDALLTEYLLCDGVVAVYQIQTKYQKYQKQEHNSLPFQQESSKHLKFKEYISSGHLISFSIYPEQNFQLIAYEDCSLIKLPTKSQLDPHKQHQRIQQINNFIARNNQFYQIKNILSKLSNQLKKENQNGFDHTFGLGQTDYGQFLSQSKIKRHQPHQKLYNSAEQIKYLGLILRGKVIAQNIKKRNKKIVAYDNALLTFYKKDYTHQGTKLQQNQTLLSEGQWVGLEQYLKLLQTNPFRMQNVLKKLQNKQVSIKQLNFLAEKQYRTRQDCEIIWIPISQFAKKINYETNFSTVSNWKAIMELKYQIKQKNDKISQQIQTEKSISKQQQQQQHTTELLSLPNLKSKFQKLSHLSGLQTITQLRRKIITQKRKKNPHNSLHQEITFSQTSLLGIAMKSRKKLNSKKNEDNDLSIQLPKFRVFSHSFRSPKQGSMNNKFNFDMIRKGSTQRVNNSFSERKMQPIVVDNLLQQLKGSPEDLIMYPDAYQPKKLSPDLRKQMFYAQKTWRLSSLNYSPKNEVHGFKIESQTSRIAFDNQNKNLTNQLSSIGSKSSLTNSMISTPQSLYNKIISKLSYKYPDLDQKLRVQKFIKKRNQMVEKVTLKQRIQTLKVLGDIQRKKRVKESRQRRNQLVIMQKDIINKKI